MSASLAILTIGVVPMSEVLPLLTEYIDEQHITHHSLLGKMSREDVMADYAVEPGDDPLLTLLNDNQIAPCFPPESGARFTERCRGAG
ncbi:AroM protein [Salmonella enterica subsp. enterica serovar Enteritidis]|nr:AroM protein [Salmonella enterica subsp. enterica serovar Enteritidis]